MVDALIEAAWELYGKQQLPDALAQVERAWHDHAGHGRLAFTKACILERLERFREADRFFVLAHKATIEPQPAPYRTAWRHFERAVERAADSLGAELSKHLESIELHLADYPDTVIAKEADNPETLGWLSGPVASDKKQDDYGVTRIYLYRRPHEHCTTSAREFDEEVRRSLYQELGRYLGLDAGDMERLGLL